MIELVFQSYQSNPGQLALLFFLLGMAVGSFAEVIRSRLPGRQSIVHPRSHCTACGHTLSVLDLVPVLSYLWLRGRCRHCGGRIPVQCVVIEISCGLSSSAAALAGGWMAGAACIAAWLAGSAFLGLKGRSGMGKSEAGSTLIEVLVAVSLLVTLLVPLTEWSSLMKANVAFDRQTAMNLGSRVIEEVGSNFYLKPAGTPPAFPVDNTYTVGNQKFNVRVWIDPLPAAMGDGHDAIWNMTVTVRCSKGCTMNKSSEVKVVAYIAETNPP